MQNIFVTGGTGLVGAHVVEAILSKFPQANVVVLVYDMDPDSYFVRSGLRERVKLVYGDIRNASVVRDAIFSFEIDTVFHLAAQPLVTAALHNPLQTWETNIIGTVHVMEAVRTSPWIRSVVVASSDKAYGEPEFQPYTEAHPLNALHPYDTSKACTDMIARSYAQCYGTPVVVSRFGNIYGPGDLHWNRLIPGAMRALVSGEVLDIRSDGTLTRDYLYVKDVAQTYLLLAEKAKEYKGEAFNCTSNTHRSVIDMLKDIEAAAGKPVPHKILNTSAHEISHQSLSNEKLTNALDQALPQTDITTALQETWNWYKEVLSHS